jgi:UDP-glucuronate 4-epimerase
MSALKYDSTQYEIINLGGGNPVTLREMVKIIEEITGKQARIDRLPLQAGDVTRTVADISKAQKLLGYHPKINLKDGILKLLNWLE